MCRRLASLLALVVVLSPRIGSAESGLQISLPSTSAVMINKDVQNGATLERWAIIYDEARGIFLGNVFRANGGEPAFIFCRELPPPNSDSKAFTCGGADRCDTSSCPGQGDWTVIAPPERPFVVPVSFVRPRPVEPPQVGLTAGCYAADQQGVAPGEFACGLRNSTGNSSLDFQFVGEHDFQQRFWQRGFQLFLFDECQGVMNAFSNPAGFILFGLNLTATTIAREGTTLPLAGILAHEVAHQLQFAFGWMNTGAPTVRPTELEADAFSGFYMALAKGWAFDPRSGYNGPLISSYFNTLASLGDTNFTNPNHHGTSQERVAAGLLGAQVAENAIRTGVAPSLFELHAIFTSAIGQNASAASDGELAERLHQIRSVRPEDFTYPDVPVATRERLFPVVPRVRTELAVTSTPSGFQVTPDGSGIVMINKDVQNNGVTERWAITYDEGSGIFLGNVFRSTGGDPAFVYCEELPPPNGSDKAFKCWGADKCDTASCPAVGDWVVIAPETRPFVVPTSFFRPRVTGAGCAVPDATPGLTRIGNCTTDFVSYHILLPIGFEADRGASPGEFHTFLDCGEIGCDVEFDADLGPGESLTTEVVKSDRVYSFKSDGAAQLQLSCEKGC